MARLFFAIWPPTATAAALHRWAGEARRESGGRAIAATSIHLTLAFLGEVGAAQQAAAQAAAARVRGECFDLQLAEVSHRIQRGLVWAAPSRLPESLQTLARALASELRSAGFDLERRAFLAHVTLLRQARRACLLPAFGSVCWPVEEFTLVRSTLDAEAARYGIVARYPLGS